MKSIILLTFFLSSLFAQYEIDGRWHLVGYEDAVMYQFENNYRYSIYSIDGTFGSIDDAGGTPNPFTIVEDIITIDLFFGNIVSYQIDYKCDGQVVEFKNIADQVVNSTLFRENYSYIDGECENLLEDCCEVAQLEADSCEGVGCYIPQCTEDCDWESMQCWGSTGYCWCVDESGIEIEGTSTPSWQGFPDCQDNIDECFDFTEIDFGLCDMVLGVGLTNGECNYISGCGWTMNGIDYSELFFDSIDDCQQNCDTVSQCDIGYVEINDVCFHEGDLSIIQKMIDNSYESEIDLGCEDGDNYCGSPNPFMDSSESWMWVVVDGESYEWNANENGIVEPLELGLQEWENGRLTSLMCGAYIYCQLSGTIPEEINQLTSINTLRLELNYLSGFIPDSICDLDTNYNDYLAFDISYNRLCPPYPDCVVESDFWGQDSSSCNEIGDINYDFVLNIQDIVLIILFILDDIELDFQELSISDINLDGVLDVLDVILIVNIILNN
jgi:hypothetical protein